MWRATLGILFGLLLSGRIAAAEPPAGPSFDCARVTSTVNKLICTTPELAALDNELALVFENIGDQAAFNAKALRREEDAWLEEMHRKCNDIDCVRDAYRRRLADLRERSLKAASPAAYAETRPFPVPPALMAEAQGLIGRRCAQDFMQPDPAFPGFVPAKGMVPVIGQSNLAVPRDKDGSRFALLLETGAEGCLVRDVVALPTPAAGDKFLSCRLESWNPGAGFGYRRAGAKRVIGYWVAATDPLRLERVALGVLGAADAVHCTEPEWGE